MVSRRPAVLAALLGVIVLLAGYLWINPAMRDAGNATPSPISAPTATTGTPTATATATAAPPSASAPPSTSASPVRGLALRSDRAWLTRPGSAQLETAVRRETDPAVIHRIDASNVEVSPDGRSLAYWSPAGVRRVLQAMPTGGGAAVTLLSLGSDEYGNAIAWSSDGTGLAVRVDSSGTAGGIDPPPSYSSVRLVEVASRQVREIARRPNARLTPLSWLRDRTIVPIAVGGGIGGYTGYAEAREDGTVRDWKFPDDFCTGPTVMRVDRAGATILSLHPSRCADATRQTAPSRIRAWSLGTDPAAGRVFEVRDETLRDAAFVPGSADVLIAIHRGDELRLDRWTGSATRTISTLRSPASLGAGSAAIVPRPMESVILFQAPSSNTTWSAKLIDLLTDRSLDVDVGGVAPYAAAALSP